MEMEGQGGEKELDSNRRGKLVVTSTRSAIQDFDCCMEEGTMIATKWAFVCQRFDSKVREGKVALTRASAT